MRIGILTMHSFRNFGSSLQACGLRRALQELGHDPEIVNWYPGGTAADYFETPESGGFVFRQATNFASRCLRSWTSRDPFDRFSARYFRLTPYCRGRADLVRLARSYDAVIAGSDNVWGCWHATVPYAWFLEFASDAGCRAISYAACCGFPRQSYATAKELSSLLQRLDHVSVRDSFTCDFVRSLSGREASVVADPTMLVDYNEPERHKHGGHPYLLAYCLNRNSLAKQTAIVSRAKSRLGMDVVAITSGNTNQGFAPDCADRHVGNAGPGTFLSLMRDASCVITDSFHGAVFAARYRRPFVAMAEGLLRGARLNDFGTRYGCSSRVISVDDELPGDLLTTTDDMDAIHQRIDAHRIKSLEFLRSSLA